MHWYGFSHPGGSGRYAGKDKNTKRKGVQRGSTSKTPQLATIYPLLGVFYLVH